MWQGRGWQGLATVIAIAISILVPATANAGEGGFTTGRLGPYQIRFSDSPFGFSISRGGRYLLAGLGHSFERNGVRYATLGYTPQPAKELEPPDLSAAPDEEPSTQTSYVATRANGMWFGPDVYEARPRTDSPNGRRMRLTIWLRKDGTLGIRAGMMAGKAGSVYLGFRSPQDEAFHGFGGRREGTDLRGSDIKSWVLDYRYPDPTTAYYSPVPGFISSRGYGLLLKGDRISRWRMASDRPTAWRVSRPGGSMEMTLTSGGQARAMAGISRLTGRHRLPPAWATGTVLSRAIGIAADSGGKYQSRVESDLEHLASADFPISAYAFEGWQALPGSFVKATIRTLKEEGIHPVLYLRSFVSNDTAGTEGPGTFDQAISRKLVATGKDGKPFLLPSPFPGGQAAVIDLTKPAAVRWWRNRIWNLLDLGADGFMNDFGEQVEAGMRFHDGTSAALMHNRYPALQAKVTRAAVDAWERRHPKRHIFFFQRAGFTGSLSSVKWESAQFPGDETVDWGSDTGLPSIVPDMLNRALTGAVGFTTDIGGYSQFRTEQPFIPPTGEELFTRWAQAAVFTPFFRVHNSGLSGARMPWDFSTDAQSTWKKMVVLHNRSRPLIRRLWKRFLKTGMPMIRPLYLAGGVGPKNPHNDDEWMVGHDLLVAPVLEEGAVTREVLLPSGCWRRSGTGPPVEGARTVEVGAALDELPWFTRCGTSPL